MNRPYQSESINHAMYKTLLINELALSIRIHQPCYVQNTFNKNEYQSESTNHAMYKTHLIINEYQSESINDAIWATGDVFEPPAPSGSGPVPLRVAPQSPLPHPILSDTVVALLLGSRRMKYSPWTAASHNFGEHTINTTQQTFPPKYIINQVPSK